MVLNTVSGIEEERRKKRRRRRRRRRKERDVQKDRGREG